MEIGLILELHPFVLVVELTQLPVAGPTEQHVIRAGIPHTGDSIRMFVNDIVAAAHNVKGEYFASPQPTDGQALGLDALDGDVGQGVVEHFYALHIVKVDEELVDFYELVFVEAENGALAVAAEKGVFLGFLTECQADYLWQQLLAFGIVMPSKLFTIIK